MSRDYEGFRRPEPQRERHEAKPVPAPVTTPGQRAAPYYTPPPGSAKAPPRPKPRWHLVGLGVVAAVGLGLGAWWAMGPGGEPAPPSPATAEAAVESSLLVSAADVDLAATEYLRKLLAGGLPAAKPASAGDQQGPDVLHAVNAEAMKALAQDSPELAQELQSGRRTLYRLHLVDFLTQDGDEVALFVDGISQGPVSLANAGTEILIPLTPGSSAQIRVVATRDGGGGVTFGLVSSLGEARTRVMHVGESEQWQVTVR